MQVDPKDIGRLEGKMDILHEVLTDIRDHGSVTARINKERIAWIWASLCGLSVVFGASFLFLYALAA
jgi:hypothetical protein